jgi:hypothetical protein
MNLSKQVRTTISLPAASLTAAKRAAKARRVKLSKVAAEALDESLKQQQDEEELMILDGIIPEHRG